MAGPRTRKPWFRRAWHVTVRTLRGVLRLEDTPYRVAMGCACGMFAAILPIIGQMLVGMALAKVFRASVLASMPWTWITNPATTPFIWYGCYRVGTALLWRESLTIGAIRAVVGKVSEQGLWTTIHNGGALFGQIAVPLVLGSVVVGLAAGALTYLVVRPLVVRVQARRAAKSALWAATHPSPASRPGPLPGTPPQAGGAVERQE